MPSSPSSLLINDSKVRMDKETGYICITDIGNLKDAGGGKEYVRNWLRNANTIGFIISWERKHNPDFKGVEFDPFKEKAGLNSFRVSAGELIEAGATGVITKRGRFGGTYCTIDWTLHFANWLDPDFYVETIDAFRRLSDLFHGREYLQQRFSRELAAKNYGLITQPNAERRIPTLPDPRTTHLITGDDGKQVRRFLHQVDADILNLALWNRTAAQWRADFPQVDARKNMRDFATNEELQVLSALQIIMRELQENQYTPEEKLAHLRAKAAELLVFYCDTEEKQHVLVRTREHRGW